MDNSVAKTFSGKEAANNAVSGINFSRTHDMGSYSVQRTGLRKLYQQRAYRFLAIFLTFMLDSLHHNTNPKEMAIKPAILITIWLAGFIGFSATLLSVNWEDVKAIILLVIGMLWSLVNLVRASIKMWREFHEAKYHIRKLNEK